MNYGKAATASILAVIIGILGDVIFAVAYFVFAALFSAAALLDPLNQAGKVEAIFGGFAPQILFHLSLTFLSGIAVGIFAAFVVESSKKFYLLAIGFALLINLILTAIFGFAFLVVTKNDVFILDMIFFAIFLLIVAPLKGFSAAFAARPKK